MIPISDQPVLKVIQQRGTGDCCQAALAMYLGLPYEDVLAASCHHLKNRHIHKQGMFTREIVRVAKHLGVILHRRKKYDLEESTGILALCNTRTGEGHVAVLKRGMIFDPADGCCWDPGAFFANSRYEVEYLITQD